MNKFWIQALVNRESKDQAAKEGFKYSPYEQAWQMRVTEQELEEMRHCVKFEILRMDTNERLAPLRNGGVI